ncbi:MAG: CPBP family intramembrane metalloprotease [Planctomycetes bacterium]|nr:CPBP family intramembrane metalloprotease [Planctomycetota bacterium]
MAKSKPDLNKPNTQPVPAQPKLLVSTTGYFAWSRDPAVSLFAVLPLWILYEGLRLKLSPSERNGAEVLLLEAFKRLGPVGAYVPRIGLAVLVLLALRSVLQRSIPWARVMVVIALEGMIYGLLLGPVASALSSGAARLAAAAIDPRLMQNMVASLGAGIFEELVFRLLLMSALFWLWLHAVGSLGLPKWVAGAAAVICSAVAFSWFHHLWGEPILRSVFLFRTMAGVILGLLFWFRGYGVCVYTHAMYDIYLYLTQYRP